MLDLLKLNNNVLYDNRLLTTIREREAGQISQQNPKRKWNQFVQMRVEIIEYIKTDEPQLFNENEEEINSSLFNNIRTLAPFDLASATNYCNLYIPKDYIPKNTSKEIGLYSKIYKLVGFRFTEILYQLIK